MRDNKYLKRTNALYEELAKVASTEPFNFDAFNDVHARIMALHFAWFHGRRRRPSLMFYIICFLLTILAVIIYGIVCPM